MATDRRHPLSEADMLAFLLQGDAPVPPVEIRWLAPTLRSNRGPDAMAEISWRGQWYRFAAELRTRSTPKVFAQALAEAISSARALEANTHPMVVMPYLGPERLDELERAGASGIDLSGNAIVQVPGSLFVYRSGSPNRFPESYPIRAVYRGRTSLVARALLLRGEVSSLSDMQAFIRSRGGDLTLTTISKALRRMEDDVLIHRRGGRARLLQADILLDKLVEEYRPVRPRRTFIGSVDLQPDQLGSRLASLRTRAIFTGQSSTNRYAVMPRERTERVYCESISDLLAALGPGTTEGTRFANLELFETDDPTVYFDTRRFDTVPFASPIQTFVELATGDAREQKTSRQVQSFILAELAKSRGER